MARGSKSGGRDWVPGQSGNPRGRPVVAPELSELRKMGPNEMHGLLYRLLKMQSDELRELSLKSDFPVQEHLMAAVLLKVIDGSCLVRFRFFVNLMFGRPNYRKKSSGRRPRPIEMNR